MRKPCHPDAIVIVQCDTTSNGNVAGVRSGVIRVEVKPVGLDGSGADLLRFHVIWQVHGVKVITVPKSGRNVEEAIPIMILSCLAFTVRNRSASYLLLP